MASLIESVRKLHGPTLIAHENGFDVDVVCEECSRLRLEALDQATGAGEEFGYSKEEARVAFPCPTRVTAGTTASEGKDEAFRLRLDRLVVQREELEERMERLDAVIGLIRRDLGEDVAEESAPEEVEEEPEAAPRRRKKPAPDEGADPEDAEDADASDEDPDYEF